MKRILSVSLTILLLFSLSFVFSAQQTEYLYSEVLTELSGGGKTDPVFVDGLWQFSYRPSGSDSFVRMSGWGEASQIPSPVYYAASPAECGNPESPWFSCMVREGTVYYPGVNVPVGITFVCPGEGTLRYTAFGYFADNINSGNAGANQVSLYQNGVLVWDTREVAYSADVEIDLRLDVKSGDVLTLAFGSDGFPAGNAFCISGSPTVCYETSEPPLSVPPSPENVTVGEITDTSFTVFWDPVPGVSGYKVLCDDVQVSPGVAYAATSYTVTGLSPETLYSVCVAALRDDGVLSVPSVPIEVCTSAKAAAIGSEEPMADTSSATEITTNSEKFDSGNYSLLFVGFIAGIAVCSGIILILFLLRGRKSKNH